MSLDKAVEYIKKKAEQWELFATNTQKLNIEINQNKIDFAAEGKQSGLGVRVSLNKRMGFAYTESINSYKVCIDAACRIARANNPNPYFHSFPCPKKVSRTKTFDNDLLAYSLPDFCSFLREFIDQLKGIDKCITISSGSYHKHHQKRFIRNAEGIELQDLSVSNNLFFESLQLKAKKETINLEAGFAKRTPFSADLAKETAERLIALQGKKPMETKNMETLLHPQALGELLNEFVSSAVNGQYVLENRSPLKGRLGEKIASEKISLRDDGKIPGHFNTRGFDDEGTPCQTTQLIKQGILMSYLYDNRAAQKTGEVSTGNAFRGPFTTPRINTTNLIMAPGEKKDLLTGLDNGLYVRGLMGVHTMNTSTGDFSLAVYEGHKVEKGQITYPVKDTMVAGNVLQLLHEVKSIGRELHQVTVGDDGGIYLPHLLTELQVISS